jgi:hypothetical protein
LVVDASLEVVFDADGSDLVSDPHPAKLRPNAMAETAMTPALNDVVIQSPRFVNLAVAYGRPPASATPEFCYRVAKGLLAGGEFLGRDAQVLRTEGYESPRGDRKCGG